MDGLVCICACKIAAHYITVPVLALLVCSHSCGLVAIPLATLNAQKLARMKIGVEQFTMRHSIDISLTFDTTVKGLQHLLYVPILMLQEA
jgi:hypothetical protein